MNETIKEIGLYEVSGDVCRFVSTARLPLESLELKMEPVQDLHGQEYPYPAGGGKNKFDSTILTEQTPWKTSDHAKRWEREIERQQFIVETSLQEMAPGGSRTFA